MSMNNLDSQIEQQNDQADTIADIALRAVDAEARGLAPEVQSVVLAIKGNINTAWKAGTEVQALHARLIDRNYPLAPGDAMAVRDEAATKKASVDHVFKGAASSIEQILKPLLLRGSLPRLADAEYDRAVKECELLLGTSGDATTRMRDLATSGDRRLAAVVTGTWGLARLGGNAELHRGIQLQAMGAVLPSEDGKPPKVQGTAEEVAHAKAFTSLTSNLAKMRDVAQARTAARMRVG